MAHTLKNLIILQLHLLSQFLLFTFVRTAPGLFESFGFHQEQPAFIAFSLFMAVSAPLNEVCPPPIQPILAEAHEMALSWLLF